MVNELPTLDMTVKEILERWPRSAVILGGRGLDLCCGGVHPLRMAAQAHGFKAEAILAELLAELAGPGKP